MAYSLNRSTYQLLYIHGIVDFETVLPITISYGNPLETIGALLPIYDHLDKIDFFAIIQEKLPYCKIDQIHVFISGEMIKIVDYDGFIWAIMMYKKTKSDKDIGLPIFVNNCQQPKNPE